MNGHAEIAHTNEIDVTRLVNKGMPIFWKCPHCGKRTKTDKYAEDILLEEFKVIRQCGRCGNLHIWELTLTDDFKQGVLDMLNKAAGGSK